MLGQAGDSAERLATLAALDLHPAVGMHPLVTAEVGKLSVAFETDLTSEWLDTAMDVGVLFQSRTGCKSFPAFWTGMRSGSNMVGPDVPLQIAWIREHLVTVLAWEPPVLSMDHFMPQQIRPPGKALRTVFTVVLVRFVSMGFDHMIV